MITGFFFIFIVKYILDTGLGTFDRKLTDKLLELRDFLSHAVNDLCTKNTICQKDIDEMNKYLASLSFCKVLKKEEERYILNIIPDKSNLNQIISKVILSFVEMITNYDIKRIKICKNPECGWIFYDESRNHTRKWCDNTCASLMKVRKFRKRHTIKKASNSG
ncbi:CGNR zinc finger domain-containing protein [Clostridium sp. MT-14]|mgnify:CR=1 FL=1|uniref:CGNR zinc finger domain-containing protein n=1 Tax=Clostridium aromativorans TaxID=2836848 RepID=A0ABS8N9J8_9CLOT|nr:CGNR zinc finger domain-containing protein [Clostridium aromativorans]MCC9296497.1 CGNR zinc finger domain-containing protein [Clostridium aromativorans]CAB1245538.1 hypothetical protein CLOSBL3_11178 [Clostridiaceae bacterium BL-3]